MVITFERINEVNYNCSDIHVFMETLSGKRASRIPYYDMEFAQTDIYELIFERPVNKITGPMDVEFIIEAALCTGKDIVGGTGFYTEWNQNFQVSSNGERHYVGGFVKSIDDVRGKMDFPIPEESFERLEKMIKATEKTPLGVRVDLSNFLFNSYLSMGIENFSVAIYTDPDLINYLLDNFFVWMHKIAQRLAEYPINLVFLDSDLAYATGLIFSPDWLREKWLPKMKQIVSIFRNKDIGVIMHTDGKIEEILPLVVEAGIQGIHPIEPAFNDITDIYKKYHGKLCLFGNINVMGALLNGTPDDVEREVREKIEAMNKGGYVCTTSTAGIMDGQTTVKAENYIRMIETIHGYKH